MWDAEFDMLSKDYRVIRYDLRGHGESSGITGKYSSVQDLLALLDGLGCGDVSLIGLSAGGAIACDFAICHPDRVKCAVLIDAFYPIPVAEKSAFVRRCAEYISTAERDGIHEGLTQWLADPLFKPANEDPPRKSLLKKMVLDGHGRQGKQSMFLNPDKLVRQVATAGKSAADVECRVLCLVGQQDLPCFHAIAKHFGETIPHVSVVEVPNAGHMANLEQPEIVLQQIVAFLTADDA